MIEQERDRLIDRGRIMNPESLQRGMCSLLRERKGRVQQQREAVWIARCLPVEKVRFDWRGLTARRQTSRDGSAVRR